MQQKQLKKRWIGINVLIFVIVQSCAFSQGNDDKVYNDTVYITKQGAKYHTEDCRYLRLGSIKINLSDAQDRGYTACSVCRPSSSSTEPAVTGRPQTAAPSSGNSSTTQRTVVNRNSTSEDGRCTAITKSGTRCKRSASSGGKCWQHQ